MQLTSRKKEWNDTVAFHSFFLMDDQILIEPDLGLRAHLSVRLAEESTVRILGPGALNAEKDAEEGALEPETLVWGLSYKTDPATVALPAIKLEKASYLLHLPDFDWKIEIKLVQEWRQPAVLDGRHAGPRLAAGGHQRTLGTRHLFPCLPQGQPGSAEQGLDQILRGFGAAEEPGGGSAGVGCEVHAPPPRGPEHSESSGPSGHRGQGDLSLGRRHPGAPGGSRLVS
jgi:hypothetical protein